MARLVQSIIILKTESEQFHLMQITLIGLTSKGRTFIWYTTEIEELSHCDRAYVFRNGVISANLAASALTEENVLHASFAEAVA